MASREKLYFPKRMYCHVSIELGSKALTHEPTLDLFPSHIGNFRTKTAQKCAQQPRGDNRLWTKPQTNFVLLI